MIGLVTLTAITDIVAKARSHGNWDERSTAAILDSYLDHLDRCAARQEALPPPGREVDLLWHVHMLHPARYSAFCEARFGAIVDHALPTEPLADAAEAALMAGAGCNDQARGSRFDAPLMATSGCNQKSVANAQAAERRESGAR